MGFAKISIEGSRRVYYLLDFDLRVLAGEERGYSFAHNAAMECLEYQGLWKDGAMTAQGKLVVAAWRQGLRKGKEGGGMEKARRMHSDGQGP